MGNKEARGDRGYTSIIFPVGDSLFCCMSGRGAPERLGVGALECAERSRAEGASTRGLVRWSLRS